MPSASSGKSPSRRGDAKLSDSKVAYSSSGTTSSSSSSSSSGSGSSGSSSTTTSSANANAPSRGERHDGKNGGKNASAGRQKVRRGAKSERGARGILRKRASDYPPGTPLRPDGKVGVGAHAEPSGPGPASEEPGIEELRRSPSKGGGGGFGTGSGASLRERGSGRKGARGGSGPGSAGALYATPSMAARSRDHTRQIGNVILLVGAVLFVSLCVLIVAGVALYKADRTDGHVEELLSRVESSSGAVDSSTASASSSAATSSSSSSSSSSAASSSSSSVVPTSVSAVAAVSGRFRVLVGDSFAPWDSIAADGTQGGINAAVVSRACAAAGIACDVITAPYADCFTTDAATGLDSVSERLASGAVDGCAGWAVTVGRTQSAQFSDPWSQPVTHRFVVPAGGAVPADLSSARIAFASGFAGNAACLSRAGLNFNAANAVTVASEADAAAAVASGAADLALVFSNFSPLPAGTAFEGREVSCAGGLAVASRKGASLTNEINRGLASLRTSGDLAALCGSASCDTTRATAAVAAPARHVLAVGPGFPPFDVVTDEVAGGLNRRLAEAVCDEANVDCAITLEPYARCWQSSGPGPAVLDGWLDACIGWFPTTARRRSASFGAEFTAAAPAKLVARPGANGAAPAAPSSLSASRVGVVAGFAADASCLAAAGTAVGTAVEYATSSLAAQAVASGTVDYAFLFESDAAVVAAAGAVFVGESRICAGGMAPMGPMGSPFLEIWNAALTRMRTSGKLAQICADYPTAGCVL